MTNNIFTVRNVFCPYKDYSRFLGDKLTCLNYATTLAKVSLSLVIFGIILASFIVYEAYFIVDEFM
jgi:hypothetical protein